MKHPHILASAALALAALAASQAARATTVVGTPDAYLDYIEATGTQYIDTGVNAETGLKARFDCAISSETQNDSSFLDAKYGSNRRFMMIHSYGQKYYFAIGDGDNAKRTGSATLPLDTRFEYVSDVTEGTAIQLYFYGTPQVTAAAQATSANAMPSNGAVTTSDMNNLTLYLFAGNFDGTPRYYGKGKLYELKIFKKDATTGELELIRHYLPCRKNGRAALYDKANGIIYFSDGDDDFSDGPEIVRPAALVEWVEADGSMSSSVAQQYVDTGVWGRLGLRSAVDFTLFEDSGDHAILAARGTGNSTDFRLYMAYHYSKYFCYGDGKLRQPKNLAPTNGVRYLIESDLSADAQSVKVNGTELYRDTFTGTSYFATSNTLALFANNHKGAYVKNPTHSRLYSAKIWDGDELLRDFAPCVATNGVAGLYDAVTERVFFPSGKAFNLSDQVGAVTNVLVEAAAPKTRLEYVDSDGSVDYVNLGVTAKDGVELDAVFEYLAVPSDNTLVGAGAAPSRFFLLQYAQKTTTDSETGETTVSGRGFYLGYADAIYQSDSSASKYATTGVKYYATTRLDAGDQFISIRHSSDGAWVWDSAENGRTTDNAGPIDTGLPLYLFARDNAGKADLFTSARVYSLKLSEKQQDGTYALVRDLIPVRDPLTGGLALWDKVGETYYRNSGRFLLSGGGTERDMVLPFVMTVR